MHKSSCNKTNSRCYNMNLYQFIRTHGGWENWDMILIETEQMNNRLSALKREREYIENFKASLKSYKPVITIEELNAYRKQYFNKEFWIRNKERLTEQAKE